MRRNNDLRWRENASQMEQIRTFIGRRLREEYDLAQPMPDRLADLVRIIEQPEDSGRGARH
jgi:hypothetical protein